MSAPQLNIPARQADAAAPKRSVGELLAWLESLPIANPAESASRMHTELAQLNRRRLDTAKRLELAPHFERIGGELVEALRKPLARGTFPVPAKSRRGAALVHGLLAELANSRKILVTELASGQARAQRLGLGASMAEASHLLAELLLNCYLQYQSVPRGVWHDLHRLYALADEFGFKVLREGKEPSAALRRVELSYKRISLLVLTNPYHLMSGEALRVYELLEQWAGLATLAPLSGSRVPEGIYFADLESDEPPSYARGPEIPLVKQGQVLGIEPLMGAVATGLRELMAEQNAEASRTVRRERDLLLRLERAWKIRRKRRFPRTQQVSRLDVASSLSACHYFISGEQRFAPEQRGSDKKGADLELLPADFAPWKRDEFGRPASGVGLASQLTSYQSRDPTSDIWRLVYQTKDRAEDEVEAEPAFLAANLSSIDESMGGLALLCGRDSSLRLQVGELVVYEPGGRRDAANWRVGAVRWLLQRPDQDMEVGIKRLSRDALALAVRAIRGIGKGGGFFRGLLIPRANPKDKATALIVPWGIYDVGTEIALHLEGEVLYARLSKVLETTGCYSVFAFQLIDTPPEERPRSQLSDFMRDAP